MDTTLDSEFVLRAVLWRAVVNRRNASLKTLRRLFWARDIESMVEGVRVVADWLPGYTVASPDGFFDLGRMTTEEDWLAFADVLRRDFLRLFGGDE